MTGPIWLAVIILTASLAAFYCSFFMNGDIEAENPGTQRLPAKPGLARFFYLLGLRTAQRRLPKP